MTKRTITIINVLTHHTTVGIIAGLALLYILSLGGCNTIKGVAKDVYAATEGLQDAMAEDNGRDDVRPDDWDY